MDKLDLERRIPVVPEWGYISYYTALFISFLFTPDPATHAAAESFKLSTKPIKSIPLPLKTGLHATLAKLAFVI